MMKSKWIALPEYREIAAGVLMLSVLLGVLFFVHTHKINQPASQDFELTATFNKVDGVGVGTKVRIGGINVGKVTQITLDPYYRVLMTLSLDKDWVLPDDTAAVIETEGYVGNKYIELVPGGSEDELTDKGTVTYTQDALLLDELLDRFLKWMRLKKGVLSNEGA